MCQRSSTTSRKAYSYVRWSSEAQTAGDSLRRQTSLAESYASRHGLELDDTLTMRDMGVSAFRAMNVRQGALGQFLNAIDEELIEPGSYLLVESLDRVSRDDPWEALPVFQQIINAGVTIVTLQDERIWNREELRDKPFRIFESLMVMIRANEESKAKSRRLTAVWSHKRETAAEKPMTGRAPAWLKLNDSSWEILEDRAEIIRRIYQWASQGIGQHQIAKRLNEEGVDTFGRGKHWHRSYIKKVLESEAPVGVLVPHEIEYIEGKRTRKPTGRIEGYFPVIVDVDLWQDVQALRAGRKGATVRGGQINNMLAGLARCPVCDAAMHRVVKGKRSSGPKLVCSRALAKAGCDYEGVRLSFIEMAIIRDTDKLINEVPIVDDEAEELMTEAHGEVYGLEEKADRLATALADGDDSPTLRRRLKEIEAELAEAQERLQEAETLAYLFVPGAVKRRVEELEESLKLEPLDRALVNTAMRQVFEHVIVNYRTGFLELKWRHGGYSSVVYTFPPVESRKGCAQ